MMGMNQTGTVTLTAALVAVLSVVAVTIGTPVLVDTIDVQPDHPLYALERAGEGINEVFVSGQSLEIERAQERTSEFVYTVGIGKSGEYKWLIEEAEEHLIHAAKLAVDNEGLQRAIEANKNHIIVLESVENRVPVEIRSVIRWAQLQGCVSTSVLRDIAGREEIYPIIPGSLKVELGDRLDEIAVGIESLRVGNLQPPEIIVGAENFTIVGPQELMFVLENLRIIWPSENVIHIENVTYVITPIENVFEVENVAVTGLRIRAWVDNNPENAETPQSDGIKSQYDGFFLTGIPIYNTYTFSDPENPPDKVDFIMITKEGENVQPEDNWVTDDNEWKAMFNMGELEPNPTLRVVVYRGSSKEPLQKSVTILDTPEWLKTLLDNASDVSFENKVSGDNRYWVMEVETESINTIESRFDAPIDYIDGIYSLNTPAMRTHFEISSDTEADFVITFLDLKMEDAVSAKIPYGKAEAKYWLEIVGRVRVTESDIAWVDGRFYVGGNTNAEFSFRVWGIPFIVEAGLRGGIWSDASFDFSLVPSENGSDEWLLLPGIAANGVGEMGVGARASLYAEVLCGVAGVEGGLEGEGRMKIQLPEENSVLSLEYGLYVRAWILFWSRYWERTESWNSEMETTPIEIISENYLLGSFHYENVENFEVSLETLGNTGMELLVEKPYPFPSPSVAINQKGEGIIVWTDENKEKDPRRAFEIFYSYYEPDEGHWTEARPVTSDEFIDFDPVVTSLEDGRMMMVWNRTPDVLGSDAGINQALGRSELAYSIWEPLTHTWSEPKLITNECLESGKALTRIGDDVVLTYVSDTDNDPFTLERNSIRYITWNGSTWGEPEKLAENLSIISTPRLAMLDENNGGLVFLNDADDNLRTLDDRRISLIKFIDGEWGEIKAIREGGGINDPQVAAIDNQIHLTWIEGTVQEDNSELDIVYIGEIDLGRGEISPPRVVKENTIIGHQRLLTDGTKLLLVYQTGENNTPYLLKHEEGIWKQEGRLAYNGRYKQLSVDASNGRLVTTAVRPMTKTIGLETKLARSDLYVSMLKELGKPEGE